MVSTCGGGMGVRSILCGRREGGGVVSTRWNGPREEMSQCGSAASKEIGVP